jgi:hypothetical protein
VRDASACRAADATSGACPQLRSTSTEHQLHLGVSRFFWLLSVSPVQGPVVQPDITTRYDALTIAANVFMMGVNGPATVAHPRHSLRPVLRKFRTANTLRTMAEAPWTVNISRSGMLGGR